MTGRTFLDGIKKESRCICGESRSVLFEFAHYDRNAKLKENGKRIDMSRLRCKKKIERELKKGRYMCVQCHRNETFIENQINVEKYMQSLVLKCTQKFQIFGRSCNGIICQGRCLKKTRFNVYKSKCDSCVSLERMMKRKTKQSLINQEKVKIGCCEYCNMQCSHGNCHLFEWDHIFGKNRKVSKLLDSSDKSIMNEILLCRLLCSKCHRLKSILESRNMWEDKPSDFQIILQKPTAVM